MIMELVMAMMTPSNLRWKASISRYVCLTSVLKFDGVGLILICLHVLLASLKLFGKSSLRNIEPVNTISPN